MNKDQFQYFRRDQGLPTVPGLMELTDHTPRTLLYGYTCSRATHHVYLGQDKLIHVLLYADLQDVDGPGMGGLDFLVLQHASGPTGGQTRPEGYVPDKRVFPEHSDFEFCKLLEGAGVDISFGGFRDDVAMSQPYQGASLEIGRSEKGVDLMSSVKGNRRFPKYYSNLDVLAYRLIAHAAKETGTPFAALGMDSQVYVADSGVDKVLRQVDAYLYEMDEKGLFDLVAESLVFSTFGKTRDFTIESKSEYLGYLTYSVSLVGTPQLEREGITAYSTDAEGHPPTLYVGSYRERPFIIAPSGQGRYTLQCSQFGDPQRFLADSLEKYKAAQPA
jgi:hypothetical protein